MHSSRTSEPTTTTSTSAATPNSEEPTKDNILKEELPRSATGVTATAVIPPPSERSEQTTAPPALVPPSAVSNRIGRLLGSKRKGSSEQVDFEASKKGRCSGLPKEVVAMTHKAQEACIGRVVLDQNMVGNIISPVSPLTVPLAQASAVTATDNVSNVLPAAVETWLDDQEKRREGKVVEDPVKSPTELLSTISIIPIMGSPFTLNVTEEYNVYDLKDFIFGRIGICPEFQLLSITSSNVVLDDDEAMLTDLGVKAGCKINLSVRAAAGISLAHTWAPPDSDEEYFVFSSTIPRKADVPSSPDGSDKEADESEEEFKLPLPKNFLNPKAQAERGIIDDETKPDVKASLAGLKSDLQDFHFPLEGLESLKISSNKEDEATIECYVKRPSAPLPTTSSSSEVGPKSTAPSAAPLLTDAPVVALTNRCLHCNIRCRPAMIFSCRCGGRFCQIHRYYDQHNCAFDIREHDRKVLGKSNPRVSGSQLD